MARWRRWTEAYEPMARAARDMIPYKYTDEAYATFPRYNLDQAVLEAIEAYDFDALPEVEELRKVLIEAAMTAGETSHNNPIEQQAIAAERQHLTEAFTRADASGLPDDPLTYGRVLSAEEKSRVVRMMSDLWGIPEGHWYPLGEQTHPSLIAFDLDKANESLLQGRIAEFLSGRGIDRVLEIREYGPCYEREPGQGDFIYDGAEGFWTSDGDDWILYCSHERSITFGGALAQDLKDAGIDEGRVGDPLTGRWQASPIITAS